MQKLNGSTLESTSITSINRIGLIFDSVGCDCLIRELKDNNQGRFSQRLNNEEENHQYEIPNSVEVQTFCRGIWSERKEHHKDAEWFKDVKKELEQDESQNKIDITKDKMMRVMRKMSNWKTPGPGNVQSYWLKNLTPLLDRLVMYLQECLDSGVVPR